MTKSETDDRIEKSMELDAPISRVWRALTDHREFGEWFGVRLDQPFVVGMVSHGRITHPGYEHLTWEVFVKEMEPERLFSFTWHPYAINPDIDYSTEPSTLVEFRLNSNATGTLPRLSESGFSRVPAVRRFEAFRMNGAGWDQQMKNIDRHVSQNE